MNLDEIIEQMEINDTMDSGLDWERLAESKTRLKKLKKEIKKARQANYEIEDEALKLDEQGYGYSRNYYATKEWIEYPDEFIKRRTDAENNFSKLKLEERKLDDFVYSHPDIETQLDTLLLRNDNIATILDRK
jgi:hypothetical protein